MPGHAVLPGGHLISIVIIAVSVLCAFIDDMGLCGRGQI